MGRNKGLNFNRRRKKISNEHLSEGLKWITSALVAILLAFFIVYSWGVKTKVIGTGMEPYLYNGQTVFISRISYLLSRPKSGDVVVFLPNGNKNSHYYVKRVIGVPGDKLKIENGKIIINDDELVSSVDYDKIAEPGLAEEEITLGVDEYFVLGDNVNNSEDSRSGNVGLINKELIEGRIWFKLTAEDSRFGFVSR